MSEEISTIERARRAGVFSQRARLAENVREGAYHRIVLEVPEIAEVARPGQFVALTVGGPLSGALLRRAFSISSATKPIGPGPGRIELVVAPHGPGSTWITEQPVGAALDVVGPLGRPFPLPTTGVPCVLVGGGYGSAPLFWLADALRERGCKSAVVLGAATRERLYGVRRAQQLGGQVVLTTDDGSLGVKGWVSDVLGEVIAKSGAAVVYACGPMGMLRSVSEIAGENGAVAQVAVEESMACGVGVCMTCVMPVTGKDGQTRMVRSCVEGPVFRGDRLRWEAFDDGWCRVPQDALGAPSTGGH